MERPLGDLRQRRRKIGTRILNPTVNTMTAESPARRLSQETTAVLSVGAAMLAAFIALAGLILVSTSRVADEARVERQTLRVETRAEREEVRAEARCRARGTPGRDTHQPGRAARQSGRAAGQPGRAAAEMQTLRRELQAEMRAFQRGAAGRDARPSGPRHKRTASPLPARSPGSPNGKVVSRVSSRDCAPRRPFPLPRLRRTASVSRRGPSLRVSPTLIPAHPTRKPSE